jgi:polysaccharide lyase-like protein
MGSVAGAVRALGVLGTTLLVGCGSTGRAASSATAGDTVFVEDFEAGSLAAWTDGVDPARHHVVTDPSQAQSGSRYLQVTYRAGGDGGWLTHFLPRAYDSLYVSFYVRFPADWRGGTKLVALYGSRTDNRWSAFGQAGKCPNGNDFFAAMVVTEQSTTSGAGPLRFYTYYPAMAREPDRVTCWGRFGEGSATYAPAPLTAAAWHHVEFCVRLNEPGRADASQAFWVDGVRRGMWSGFSLRESAILRLNAVQLTFSRGTAPFPQRLDVDNVLVRARAQDRCRVPGF